PIFDTEPEQKVQNDDHYDVFAIEYQHPEHSKSVHKTYLIEQDAQNVINDDQIDQNDEDADLAEERELLASLIEKLKCEINESKNRNKFLETSNKVLIDKLKSEIKDFKNKNNSLELSNNQFKEANNKMSEENDLLQQYPHNLLKPLPLIPNNRGRRVIPFEHFINNDLEYLREGASNRKYTTSITKSKAADYGYIKWIEDLFYGFAVNRESARDVYFKRRIIVGTDLKIFEWHNYKHLDWITLTNLTIEERFAFNVSLRMFTRSIVIQRRVEDLQLAACGRSLTESRKLPEEAQPYKARHVSIRSKADGMLNDVRNALDDRLKGIRMQYLHITIWRKEDKDRAAAMIQAIDKMLKTRRIMRSLERFVGGRQYEGDF
nr:hypothetical protein [Tanacetum cinerariifolium]